MDIPRDVCYQKELDIKLSRSYGPGRYDLVYEHKGVDYPIGYVRWTEQRNMQAFLDLLAAGRLDIAGIITHRFPFGQAENAYDLLASGHRERGSRVPLGILFEYDTAQDRLAPLTRKTYTAATRSGPQKDLHEIGIGFIGAGGFARRSLLPALLKRRNVRLVGLATASGISAKSSADRFDFIYCTGDYKQILDDPNVNVVFIATRHNLHARLAAEALQSGKAVFVEKPLALNEEQLEQVLQSRRSAEGMHGAPILMVGFNRRFAPFSRRLKEHFVEVAEPLMVHYRVNGGFIPKGHWTQDADQGGGRILGEVCHFVDWIQFLVGSQPVQVSARALPDGGVYQSDNVVVTIAYANGSVGTILYSANGDKSVGKERAEVMGGGRTGFLNDFRELVLAAKGHKASYRARLAQDKGHAAEMRSFVDAIQDNKPAPIPLVELIATTRVTFSIMKSLREKKPIDVPCWSYS